MSNSSRRFRLSEPPWLLDPLCFALGPALALFGLWRWLGGQEPWTTTMFNDIYRKLP